MLKLVLAAVLLCVGYVAAERGTCDPLDRFKVKHQWNEAFSSGHRRLEFAVKIFARLFKEHPETQALYADYHSDNIFSPEFEAHAERVLSTIDVFIGLLDDQAAFTAHLAWVKAANAGKNYKPEYFQFLVDDIISLLPQTLGTRLDVDAWRGCFKLVSDGIH